jgi:glycosyltransferase involved in cell wall biosynthesis
MNVLFAEPPPPRRVGGIETALAGLSRALAADGVRVTRAERFDDATLAAADVVHFHGLWEPAHLRARRRCRALGKPMIVSPHGMLEDWAFRHRGWKKRPYFYLFERPSIARADIILATSREESVPLARWFPAGKIRVLPLGADPAPTVDRATTRARLEFRDDEFTVLFLSRCHEKKGLHLLIAALPAVAAATGRRLHLVVVGDGAPGYVDPLRAATARWTAPLRCTWVGAVWGPEKWDYLTAADLFCLPSFSENFGLAIVEALFAGTPVLTTFGTPWPSLRGGLPVYLTQPTIPELSHALAERIAATPAEAGERSATRESAIAMFNWSALAPRYTELYRQLANRS